MIIRLIKSNKFLRAIKSLVTKRKPKKKFEGSQNYWENRYLANKNSGSGSYGRLAQFKAEVLNDFVKKQHIESVIELGCGDGHQLSLANYPNYVGFDVSNKAIELCQKAFKGDKTKSFFNSLDSTYNDLKADLVLSLDVIYHLIEDDVFHDYMTRLFKMSNRYVIIYSSNYNEHLTAHVKCRKFTDWIETHQYNEWELLTFIKNRYPFKKENPNHTSMADFYIYKSVN